MKNEYHVLSLGAGVQSTTIYLLAADGELGVTFDAAVFSDTGEEPADVYTHLDWLETQGGAPIVRIGLGSRLGDDLINGTNSTGQRFASIPAFTSSVEGGGNGSEGITRRQCTSEYKIQPIEKWIRYELLGLKPKQRIPKGIQIHQYMGFSVDEPGRAARARLRFKQIRWGEVHFPLFNDDLLMSRQDCKNYLAERVPHPVPRSACVFCPYKSNREWLWMKQHDPDGWKRAVEVDNAMRTHGARCAEKMNEKLYVHRSCRPLQNVNLGEDQMNLFDLYEMECEGGCGL